MKGGLVLVTRPAENWDETCRLLEARGYACRHAPLLRVERLEAPFAPDGFDAVFFTSANAVRAIASRMPPRTRCFTVGEAAAGSAVRAGFTDVKIMGGTVSEACEVMETLGLPPGFRLLYPSGMHITAEITTRLARAGIAVQRVPVYVSHFLPLEKDTITLLNDGMVAWILLFSRRTAEALRHGLDGLPSLPGLHATGIAGLSHKACEPVGMLGWRERRTAPLPTLRDLVGCLDG